jgi:phosphate/sulfate permease
MYGRNGIDDLYHFLFWIIIIISLVNLYFKSWVIYAIESFVLAYVIFRVLSKNVYRRQKENQIYLKCLGKIRRFYKKCARYTLSKVNIMRNMWKDRKTHVYKKCPQCKNTLRLPKLKGKHTAACPCCDSRFDVTII